MDLSQPEFGLSLLTDCKYGYEARDQMIGLTLLKGPMYPDPVSDLGEHTFTYSLYPHALGWREAGTIEAAADLNEPALVSTLSSHGGEMPPSSSFMLVDKPGVTLEAVKRAEEGSDIVVRLVERLGQNQTVRLRPPVPARAAADCDLLEREQASLEMSDGAVSLKRGSIRDTHDSVQADLTRNESSPRTAGPAPHAYRHRLHASAAGGVGVARPLSG